jgi:hypothetical protein
LFNELTLSIFLPPAINYHRMKIKHLTYRIAFTSSSNVSSMILILNSKEYSMTRSELSILGIFTDLTMKIGIYFIE